MVSHEYPLTQFEEAFRKTQDGSAIKVVLCPGEQSQVSPGHSVWSAIAALWLGERLTLVAIIGGIMVLGSTLLFLVGGETNLPVR